MQNDDGRAQACGGTSAKRSGRIFAAWRRSSCSTTAYPIFGDEQYSFGEMQVVPLIDGYFGKEEVLRGLYVYDDGIIKGFCRVIDDEIEKLYVESCFQSRGVGGALLRYAVETLGASRLWVLEKNTRAIAFYQKHSFSFSSNRQFAFSGKRRLEEGTAEYLLEMILK